MNNDDKAPDTIPVESCDILSERSELYRGMAFEADREVKRLQARLAEVQRCVHAADDELANWQRSFGADEGPHGRGSVSRARSALCRAKETL